MPPDARESLSPGAREFHTTHWSVVLAARGDRSGAQVALEKLCQAYWYPLYAFVRRQGMSGHDAQDLTQEFFARLLEKGWLAVIDLVTIGAYHVLATLAGTERNELVLGYDTKLLRRVWIRKTSADAAPGTPLTALLAAPQLWKSVRHWLLDLATELDSATRDGSLPDTLSLDRVWITADGGAKLLDFSAPGSTPVAAVEPGIFLNHVAISALEGRLATAEEARTREARLPIAIRARGVVQKLRATDVPALVEQLKVLVQQVPHVTHRRRLGLVAGCVAPALLMLSVMFAAMKMIESVRHRFPEMQLLGSSIVAALFRGGLLMRALGVAVVLRDGADASRWRMLWPACIAWSWLPATAFATVLLNGAGHSNISIIVVGLPLLALLIWSAAMPVRSLPDRLAGTWLVPR